MRQTLAYEKNADAGGSNNIYDLYLVYNGWNEVQLIIFMKILFTFVDGKDAAGAKVSWGAGEQQKFVDEWQGAVATAWTARRYMKYKDIDISIHVSFDIRIGDKFHGSHWQIFVEKLPASSTGKTSFVWKDQLDRKYDVQLDSMDNLKKAGVGDGTQTGAIHEFGHMLGLGDEYTADAKPSAKADTKSIMNSGSTVRPRHYHSLVHWAIKQMSKAKKQIDDIQSGKKPPVLWDANKLNPRGYA